MVPPHSNVVEIGCGTGELLNALDTARGVGIDFSENMISIAARQFPTLNFQLQDIESLLIEEKFDYIILSDLISHLYDIQKALNNLHRISHQQSKIIIGCPNYLWKPVLKLCEYFGIKTKPPHANWLRTSDIIRLLEIEGFEVICATRKILIPIYIPVLSGIINKVISNLPFINSLCLISFITARQRLETSKEFSVSIIVPAQNEKKNIENALLRTPSFGIFQEFIYVEGQSSDGTFDEIMRIKHACPEKRIVAIRQSGKGKGNAVREGFAAATGEILMILDADLTTPPEELVKFYEVLKKNRGEFINGCRLVYPVGRQAMRRLNFLANKFFGLFFTFILGQKIRDTLCGSKALYRSDYEKINKSRAYFGDFDPFGDFDLLLGAGKLNLKITEILVRYKERNYGTTQINRFKHGWLLLKMSFLAARKIKFR